MRVQVENTKIPGGASGVQVVLPTLGLVVLGAPVYLLVSAIKGSSAQMGEDAQPVCQALTRAHVAPVRASLVIQRQPQQWGQQLVV